MLKRNFAVLIAGALLSAQAGLAVAENASWKLSPAEVKYFEEQAARNPNPTGGPSPVFPASTGTRLVASPELIKYFADRTARGPIGVPGGVFNDGCVKNAPG